MARGRTTSEQKKLSTISKILLIEDDDVDARQIKRIVKNGFGEHVDVDWVTDKENGILEIAKNKHDICLVDYKLGKDDGVELLRDSVSQGCKMPFILLTGMNAGIVDIAAMEAGASDYLVKGDLTSTLLVKSIRYAIARQHIHNSLVETKELLNLKNTKLSELYATAHQFVDNVSHEFRTPLTVIKEFSSILSDGLAGEVNDDQKRYLNIIQDRTGDLSIMIDDMLDISRMEAGLIGVSRRSTSITEVFERIESTLERKATGSDVNISFEVAEELKQVFCDPENIARVISNLGFNAIKFSGRDGNVKVLAEMNSSDTEVKISVSDDGPGISKDHVKTIFERFEQVGTNVRASTKGFGLGLNIALELVHMNLGNLSVESELGEGSTFYFSIPIDDPDVVIKKYIDSLSNYVPERAYLTVFDIRAKSSVEPQDSTALYDFLQRQLRRTDLLLSNGKDSWLLFAQISPLDVAELVERYSQALEAHNMDVLNTDLPVLTYTRLGFWNLRDEQDNLMQEFLQHRSKAS